MRLGFIGCGKMATALVRGLIASKTVQPDEITASDADAGAAARLAEATGVRAVRANAELRAAADVLVLCVKPPDVKGALAQIDTAGSLLISIVAGLTLQSLQKLARPGTRLIRVMPNTPALVHKGAAAFALGPGATDEDAAAAQLIFTAVGMAERVPEELLDAVTGLSGSGPAYAYLVIEALADGAVLMGMPRDLALRLAAQTLAGAAEMVLATKQHPAALRDMVTSPGGTTIAGIEALETHGARAAFVQAVRAATDRARVLGSSAQ
jgi:pyrroline-5-carboxylate reductase